MTNRTEIAGEVTTNEAGVWRSWRYAASYGMPVFDGDLVRLGWSATVDGIQEQPESRTTIFRATSNEVTPELIRQQIEVGLRAHVAARQR